MAAKSATPSANNRRNASSVSYRPGRRREAAIDVKRSNKPRRRHNVALPSVKSYLLGHRGEAKISVIAALMRNQCIIGK